MRELRSFTRRGGSIPVHACHCPLRAKGPNDGFPPTATSTVAIPDDRLSVRLRAFHRRGPWGACPPKWGVQATLRYVRFTSISLKNSEIEARGKSRIHAHSVVYASRCHSKAYERVARSKAGPSAEPLRKIPLRLPAVS